MTDKLLGFTFVELLVVVAIIGVIVVLISPLLPAGLQQGRDTRRKEDIKQYRQALENYAPNNNFVYPQHESTAVPASTTLCSELGSFISSCPQDPTGRDETFVYNYQSDSDGFNWVLWAKMERSGNFWALCSNGRSGELSGVSISSCDTL